MCSWVEKKLGSDPLSWPQGQMWPQALSFPWNHRVCLCSWSCFLLSLLRLKRARGWNRSSLHHNPLPFFSSASCSCSQEVKPQKLPCNFQSSVNTSHYFVVSAGLSLSLNPARRAEIKEWWGARKQQPLSTLNWNLCLVFRVSGSWEEATLPPGVHPGQHTRGGLEQWTLDWLLFPPSVNGIDLFF